MEKGSKTDIVMTLIGLLFFWSYFRYQSVFGALFPSDGTIEFDGLLASPYLIFLFVLTILSLVVFACSQQIEFLLKRYPASVLIGTFCGFFGMILQMGLMSEDENTWILLGSTILVSLGFLTGYLAWACKLSSRFGPIELVLLSASYFLSLLIVNGINVLIPLIKPFMIAVTPLCVGFSWYANVHREPFDANAKLRGKMPRRMVFFIVLFIAFLLAGSIIRGIVDYEDPIVSASFVRWITSLTVSLLMFIGCFIYFRSQKANPSELREKESAAYHGDESGSKASFDTPSMKSFSFEQLGLMFWIALAVLFFTGMLICLAFRSYEIGGHIVVVARSSLDLVIWMFLCAIAYHARIAPVRMFCLCGLFVEIAAWLLSYLVKVLLGRGTVLHQGNAYMLVLLIALSLMILVSILLAGLILWRRFENAGDSQLGTKKRIAHYPMIPLQYVEKYHLTDREVEVITLFAQGYSLNFVATSMFISKSTAQTHIKSAYRKLGIHTKDELIKLVADWNEKERVPA